MATPGTGTAGRLRRRLGAGPLRPGADRCARIRFAGEGSGRETDAHREGAGSPRCSWATCQAKEGSLAGPRVLEHLVDCVLSFEGERERTYRTLRAEEPLRLDQRGRGLRDARARARRGRGRLRALRQRGEHARPAASCCARWKARGRCSSRCRRWSRRASSCRRAGSPTASTATASRWCSRCSAATRACHSVGGCLRLGRRRCAGGRAGRRPRHRLALASAAKGIAPTADRPLAAFGELGLTGELSTWGTRTAGSPRRASSGSSGWFARPNGLPRYGRLWGCSPGVADAPGRLGRKKPLRNRDTQPRNGTIPVESVQCRTPETMSQSSRRGRNRGSFVPSRWLLPGRPYGRDCAEHRPGRNRRPHLHRGVGGAPASCSGGVKLDVDYTPALLYQLAKMDGAIVLAARHEDHVGERPAHAGPHDPLARDRHPAPGPPSASPSRPTRSSIAISEPRRRLALPGRREVHPRDIPWCCEGEPGARHAGQVPQPAGPGLHPPLRARVRGRRDAPRRAHRAQRAELVTRMAVEIERYIVELGAEALIEMRLEETMVGVAADKSRSCATTSSSPRRRASRWSWTRWRACRTRTCSTSATWPSFGYDRKLNTLDHPASPRGYRILRANPTPAEDGGAVDRERVQRAGRDPRRRRPGA